jgi:uncharacterized protein (TIGR02271 family)
MARTVVGHFNDRASADSAYDDLLRSGFDRDDVSIIGRGREGGTGLHDDDHVSAGEGAAVGGITGLLLGAAAMLIPGIGPIVAAGPLAAALAGALTGAATGVVVGGIAGALVDAGVPEEEARYYDERFQKGGYLLTVRADDMEADRARMILRRHHADMRDADAPSSAAMDTRPGMAATTTTPRTTDRWDDAMPSYRSRWQNRYGSSGGRWEDYEPQYRYGWERHREPRFNGRSWTDAEPELRRDWEQRYHDKPWDRVADHIRDAWDDREQTTQLREERLRPEKESVEAGEVRLRKDVVTEQRSVDVPVTHEEVYVERRPVTGGRRASGDLREGEEIRVPVREEEVRLEKQTVVTEEVNVGKRPVTEQERLTGTVRREEARLETTGDVDVRGAGTTGTTGANHKHKWVGDRCEDCGERRV